MYKLSGWFLFVILIGIFLIGCNSGVLEEESSKYKDIETFVKSYNRFNPSNADKNKADSVGQVLLSLKNSQEQRALLTKYIFYTASERKYIDELFKRSREEEDLRNEAYAYYWLGIYFSKSFQIDSTYYNYTKAEFLFKSIHDSVALQDVYLSKATILLNNSIYAEGQLQTLKAMALNRGGKKARLKYAESMMMSNALRGLEQYDEALKEANNALKLLADPKIKEEFNDETVRLNEITVYSIIADIYNQRKEYDRAKELINHIIQNYVTTDSPYDSLMLAQLLYLLSEADIRTQSYKNIETNLNRAIELHLKYENLKDHYSYKNLLAEYYYLVNNSAKAEELLDEVITYAKKKEDLVLEKNALSVLLKFEEENYQENFVRYEDLNRYILDENNIVKNTFARLSFEADALERANKKLQNQKDIITKVGAGLFIIAIGVFFIILFRQKSKEVSLVKLFQKDTEKYYDSIMNVQNELAEARSLERKEIAKELHDGVLNRLFVTRFLLMQVNQDSVDKHKDSLINEVKEVEQYIRDVSHTLYSDDDFMIKGFDLLITDLVEIQNRNNLIVFTLHIAQDMCFNKLDHKYKVHLYRIIQECLQNVHKHSKATMCKVTILRGKDKSFEVIIKDNGIGFDTAIYKKGLGFKNIKERLGFMNSNLVIDTVKGEGTTISFVIDITKFCKEE